MVTILIYNLSAEAKGRLKTLCRKLCFEARTVEKDEYGYELGYLLGLSENATRRGGEDFDGAMLYISGLSSGMLNIFLDQLRRSKIAVPLKAVRTAANLSFTSYELFRELSAEREAIARGLTAHGD